MGGDEAREVSPRIHMNAAPPTEVGKESAVHDAELEAELVPHLLLPLQPESMKGRRSGCCGRGGGGSVPV